MAGVLGAAVLVQRGALDQPGGERVVAGVGAAAVVGRGRLPGRGLGGRAVDGHGRDQLLELPLGLGPAGRALAQVLLGPVGDGGRVRLAQVPARPAVELGHGGHHQPGRRLALGQLHPLLDRQLRVVPGELLLPLGRVGLVLVGRADAGRTVAGGPAGRHVHQAGEEAAEPRPLLGAERGGVGDHHCGHRFTSKRGEPRKHTKAHEGENGPLVCFVSVRVPSWFNRLHAATATAANVCFSSSTDCRTTNCRNDSSGPAAVRR